ncbi:MAG TPA: 2-amino-4-hydroxy-6-hydroxymethyldihydropteridine diphosphokinase [Rhodanobacteraceae bacterium]|nr:2-amino-4-hydroxy-6-hydroxymethyldihydropteridine diphosphokinase [Rhodanobacteraceae bacterium]
MTRFYLSLGSNLEPEEHLHAALRELRERFGALMVSSVYESEAVGFDGPPFWNLAAGLESDLDLDALSAWLHELEDRQGRRRDQPRYADRTLDIDVVAFGMDSLDRPEWKQAFLLAPLAEIEPRLPMPEGDETVGDRWRRMRDSEDAGSLRKLDIDLLR